VKLQQVLLRKIHAMNSEYTEDKGFSLFRKIVQVSVTRDGIRHQLSIRWVTACTF